ncbi:DoxX family membrane protein [Bradymonas sediminis]|uniref:Uncharacterized protein n=2 Tax=Bradymonas sediminis TaxID=1548548 RepID=A0A2Z4FP46_9DELT|nr:DoxX family membrane protein [Bradymonas sediminis]AWV90759.1 hypothetical protein DN745_16125 [Bradymonas sediminis]TDP62598.1 putative oxidoreductase [Bradymonas sediminis]
MQNTPAETDLLAKLTAPLRDKALVIFRVMLSTIFLVAGTNHLTSPNGVATRLESAPLGFLATSIASAELLVIASGVALLLGGLALAAGFKTRWAALLLILLLIPITITVQVGSLASMGPLAKNIGLGGGLIYFLAFGNSPASTSDLRLN